ncbi:MAG: hypothetical protein EOP09_19345 [Proteobacteria bacterium]|nr:MAG: hypothetical protein EOP09_19345 [Pseudomonadota bacterium]
MACSGISRCRCGSNHRSSHHSHLVQPIEEIKTVRQGTERSAFVLYSLGNFATAMGTEECRTGLVQEVRVDRDDQGFVTLALADSYEVYNQPQTRHQGRKLILK